MRTEISNTALANLVVLVALGCVPIEQSLGTGDSGLTDPQSATVQPTLQVPTPSDPNAFTQLALGLLHGCALRAGGHVYCWGSNFSGELGIAASQGRGWAEAVPGLDGLAAISAGGSSTCAIGLDGGASCWGEVFIAQDGTQGGYSAKESLPTPMTALTNIVQFSHGDEFNCARLGTGEVRCWGLNHRGQLGDGTRTGRAGAESAVGPGALVMNGAIDIASGDDKSCALDVQGRVFCWGRVSIDQSYGTQDTDQLSPTQVEISDVLALDVGRTQVCALQRNGKVYCWGSNFVGQLGNGSTQGSLTPVQVAGLSDAVKVVTGGNQGCALRATGSVVCWGDNYQGILGTGDDLPHTIPAPVVELDDVYELDKGDSFTCALSYTKGLLCWGNNANLQVGDGTDQIRTRPVPVVIVD